MKRWMLLWAVLLSGTAQAQAPRRTWRPITCLRQANTTSGPNAKGRARLSV